MRRDQCKALPHSAPPRPHSGPKVMLWLDPPFLSHCFFPPRPGLAWPGAAGRLGCSRAGAEQRAAASPDLCEPQMKGDAWEGKGPF